VALLAGKGPPGGAMPDETNYSPRDAPLGDPSARDKTGSLVTFPRARPPKKRPPDNLPLELTSFVGREREVAEVERLLSGRQRLVTFCGPGGCGKTRLERFWFWTTAST
jgi:hypothetical protein